MTTVERIKEFDFVKKSLEAKNTPFALFEVECMDGWSDLIYDLCKKINDLDYDGIVFQIKEKFGALRFYISGGDEHIHKLIDDAEILSEKICEVCGKEGKLINDRGWYMTRCDEHIRGNKNV